MKWNVIGIRGFRKKYTQFACTLQVGRIILWDVEERVVVHGDENNLVFNCKYITRESDTASWGKKFWNIDAATIYGCACGYV